MYQDDKGNYQRTEAEEHVFWGMRLLKIAFILLIIGFAAYFIESIFELTRGLEYTTINPVYDLINSPRNYVATAIFLTIYSSLFTVAIFVLSFGALYLSKMLPDPVKKELKINGMLFLTLIPIRLIGQIIRYSLYTNYSYGGSTGITMASAYITFAVNVLEFLFLVIIAIKMGKELRRMNEMQQGKNGTIAMPWILFAMFMIWLIGSIMFSVIVSIEGYSFQLRDVILAAIYVEGIGQILYSATVIGTFIILLIKANKIAISPLAAMNYHTYY